MVQPNDVYILAVLFVLCSLVFGLPRRLPVSAAGLIMLLSFTLTLALDFSFGMAPFDLYDLNHSRLMTFDDFLTWLIYPAAGYLFVWLYDRWNVRGLGIPLYVLAAAILGTVWEVLGAQFGVFEYKGWKYHYSFLVNVLVLLLVLIVYRILKKHLRTAQDVRL